MYKFRPSNLAQNHIKFTELQLIGLIEKGLSDSSLRGYLYKRSSPNGKWRLKWFLLFENLLFYFDVNSADQQQAQSKQQQSPQQQQQQHQYQAVLKQADKQQHDSATKSPRRTLSSLIKRGSTKQQSRRPDGSAGDSSTEPNADLQQLEVSAPEPQAQSSSVAGEHVGQFRRASASELPASAAATTTAAAAAAATTAANFAQESSAPAANQQPRGRISSDPQRAVSDSLNLCTYAGDLYANCSLTMNSSSISGVSGHFSGHNEQTIGRSTTTTAGKMADSATNYASLLQRRKGVVFLEGSYCERLAEFPISSGLSSLLSPSKRTRHSIGGCRSPTKKSNRPSADTSSPLSAGKSPVHISASHGFDHYQHQVESEFNCIFTLKWKREGSKEYQFRCETEAECQTWVHAISNARYSTLLNDKEQLEQKYLHLSQIIESEVTAKWQYSRQCEEFSAEILKLRHDNQMLKVQESRTNHLRLVASRTAAICGKLLKRREQRREQEQEQPGQNGDPQVKLESDASKAEDPPPPPPSYKECAELQVVGGVEPATATLLDEAQELDEEQEEEMLRQQLKSVVDALNSGLLGPADCLLGAANAEELRKIKKVQGFFRGWLCRRRWKQIVDEYIKSPHAESMRKRNNLVFHMVECEEEYVEQLALLISAFLRPLKMAASSQKPALDHDELNSIFLNSETLLFLHQIFLKGLTSRMESWPTLVLGDLFNMLLPMLQIYQEFVRNHHFSLQVLAECKQREQFSLILRRLEEKPQLNGRTLETFLTYPMYQIPRYITCLHDILAHTPHNHVERKSLYEAQTKLEELSQQMQDEVSETENIRQNLAIERMIIGGCDILLDVNQVFVRQGVLLQVAEATISKTGKLNKCRFTPFGSTKNQQQQLQQHWRQLFDSLSVNQFAQSLQPGSNGLSSVSLDPAKESIRQCYLFTNHLLLSTRRQDGKLHLAEGIGRISLSEVTLIENPVEFILQQETIIANFDSVQQQQQQRHKPATGANNSLADCLTPQLANLADGGSNGNRTKRTSTVSAPGKWAVGKKRVSHVEFELDTPAAQQRANHSDKRAGSVFSAGKNSPDEWSASANRRKASSVSSRSWLPGYLATKLSSLTGGASSSQLDGAGTSSAPPSPLAKKRGQQAGSKGDQQTGQQASGSIKQQRAYLRNLFNLSREFAGCDFILLLECNTNLSASSSTLYNSSSGSTGQGCGAGASTGPLAIHLVAPNLQEKAAWMSDISQCIDNVHFNDLFHGLLHDNSSLTMNQSVRNDPRLYKDDIDIKFSRALKSCKLPQIRYASIERLFERLTDLRFLSIDFLNTFLLTYRVFTTAEDVLEALKSVHYNSDRFCQHHQQQQQQQVTTAGHTCQPTAARDSLSEFAHSSMNSLSNHTGANPEKTPATLAAQVPSEQATKFAPNQQQKPCVPPRQLQQQPSETTSKYLLAPAAAQQQHQKRRSTISALTPITGSTSSSLVNLATSANKSQQANREQLQQPEPRNSTSGNDSANSSVFRICGSSTNIDDELLANSMHLSDDYLVDQDLLLAVNQSSFDQQKLERVRSSSVSNAGQFAPDAGATSARLKCAADGPKNALDVPGCRQVRASSVSHVPGLARGGVRGRQQASGAGNEHWRLSYRKSAAINSDKQLSGGGESTGTFLTATRYLASSPNSSNRRASSSDVDVTFRVTVHVDSQQPAATATSDKAPATDEEPASLNLNLPTPNVPPSSPAEPATSETDLLSLAIDCDTTNKPNETDKKQHKRGKRRRCKTEPTHELEVDDLALSSSPSLSSAELSAKSTSDSESVLIQSTSNSSESSSLASSSAESLTGRKCQRNRLANGHPNPRPRSGRHKRQLSRSESGKAKLASYKQPALVENGRQISLIIKEIELTEAKVLDCDTSADEEKVVTTSSEDDLSCSDESEAPTKRDDEKRDIKLLTRLNSTKKVTNTHSAATVTCKPQVADDVLARKPKELIDEKIIKQDTDLADKSVDKQAKQQQEQRQQSPTKTPETDHLKAGGRPSMTTTTTNSSRLTTPRSSFAHHTSETSAISKAGVVISSSAPRISSRRSSTASAASAFAAATAASNNPLLTQPPPMQPVVVSCDCIYQQQANLRRCSTASSPSGHYRVAGAGPPGSRAHVNCDQQLSARSSMVNHLHRPNCVNSNLHHQHQHLVAACSPSHSFPNVQSDASSPCNSRASSRLSSCAGLEYNYCYSSANANFYMNQPAVCNSVHCNAKTSAYTRQRMQTGACPLAGANNRAANKRNSASQLNVRSVATIRVLSVLRHWVSKHSRDFVNDTKLSYLTQEFLQDLIMDSSLLPAEHKAALQLQQMVQKAAQARSSQVDFDLLLAAPPRPVTDSIETLSALSIAEAMTYLDHKIFLAIRSEEFLDNAWQKKDKAIKAPHILLITKRFNDASCLVSSEILRAPELHRRVAIIEKWTNVAHICRVVHNFNGVLQICAAFSHSSVLRLKKTWDRLSKTTKATVDQLQNLVSTGSKFRNMRDALNRCDPPSIPYVGMYLADLNTIEEGTPNYSPDGLLNFSKMRMIAHVIREIQHLQHGSYKIDVSHRVLNYLLDETRHLTENEMETLSHAIEPRQSSGKSGKNGVQLLSGSASTTGNQSANGAPPNSQASGK